MTSLQQRILKMVQCFRKEWRLFSDSERTTVCGADCMLMALQLAVAEVNKKQYGDFKASLSEVILAWNHLLPDKLGLPSENVNSPENYGDIRNTYSGFLKHCNMMDIIDVYQKCGSLEGEENCISPVQLLEFITKTSDSVSDNTSVFPAPSTPTNRLSQDNKELSLEVKKTLYAYLSLLVNSKNDLAFARILNIPDRGLGREAFTDLKHAAQKRQMSIFPPKLHAINHDTVYCGRDTVKFLLVLLDEAATHLPATNKAELLFDDKCGFPSTLMLYKSPAQSSGSSPKVLRERIQKAIDRRKLKLKQPLIRSQFACTYKDDQTSEKKDGPFSTSQIPTCIHPAPKERTVLCPLDASSAECLRSHLASAALGTSSGNVHQNGSRSKEIGKSSCQPRNESSKRKQVDRTSENVICANENESLQHVHRKRPKAAVKCQNSLDSKIKGAGKCNKVSAKNKLIVGQAKLTRFFEL
ncbi:PCNA-interacting partner isoform X4 [Sphaerodactylus townsendi]|uniref:PCNA-interacting partner isoform X4 n=1 Tax=Sphaerodactylus townsendi TaxID=933632 RepID=UPI002026E7C7|nr:PCNA-interacting partner isoform X4 [Sphaerodactylus townsendi]